jgi:hypothetical protein
MQILEARVTIQRSDPQELLDDCRAVVTLLRERREARERERTRTTRTHWQITPGRFKFQRCNSEN